MQKNVIIKKPDKLLLYSGIFLLFWEDNFAKETINYQRSIIQEGGQARSAELREIEAESRKEKMRNLELSKLTLTELTKKVRNFIFFLFEIALVCFV